MAIIQALARAALLCALALVSACSIYSLPGQTPAPIEKEPDYRVVTPPAQPPGDEVDEPPADIGAVAAYGPLLDKAEAATQKGDYERALSLLERAQRIDPDSAEIYLAMARTHEARGDLGQARATAERGLLYCRGQAECEALRGYTR